MTGINLSSAAEENFSAMRSASSAFLKYLAYRIRYGCSPFSLVPRLRSAAPACAGFYPPRCSATIAALTAAGGIGGNVSHVNEGDLIALARSVTANEVSWLGQAVTINFAMVVGIYYFLNRAQVALKVFAFVAYVLGMLLYLGEILLESTLRRQAISALQALPHRSSVAQAYLDISQSWLERVTLFLFNGAFWVLVAGVFYLLFRWRREQTE